MTNFNTVKDYIENSYGDALGRSSALEALEKLHAKIEELEDALDRTEADYFHLQAVMGREM